MNHKSVKERIRAEAAEEAKQDEEKEARIELRLRKWKRATMLLGVALVASLLAVTPFAYGHPLHNLWDAVGKRIMQVSAVLFLAFMYAAGTSYTFWSYLRAMKKIHKRFAPPGQ